MWKDGSEGYMKKIELFFSYEKEEIMSYKTVKTPPLLKWKSRKHQMPKQIFKGDTFSRYYWKEHSSLITHFPFVFPTHRDDMIETYIIKRKQICGINITELKRILIDENGEEYDG